VPATVLGVVTLGTVLASSLPSNRRIPGISQTRQPRVVLKAPPIHTRIQILHRHSTRIFSGRSRWPRVQAQPLIPGGSEIELCEDNGDEYEDSEDDDGERYKMEGLPVPTEGFARTSSDIGPNESLQLFPTFAFKTIDQRTGKERWATRLHGRAIDNLRRHHRRRVGMSSAAKALGFYPSSDDERKMYRHRMDLFLFRAARGRQIGLDMGPGLWWGTSSPNGHFSIDAQISADHLPVSVPGKGAAVSAPVSTLPLTDGRVWRTNVYFVPPHGVSLISDIDDTIKMTEVRDRKRMLSNTFLYDFTAVKGMSELYNLMADKGATFHYVSNSPWQLQPELEDFLQRSGFPDGTFHLKHLRFRLNRPIAFLKNRLGLRPKNESSNHKYDMISNIMRTFPERKFVLVGDSGEKDPVIYAKVAHESPKQVEKVYIRRVEGDLRNDTHWEKVFEGIPSGKWCVFTDHELVRKDVEKLFVPR